MRTSPPHRRPVQPPIKNGITNSHTKGDERVQCSQQREIRPVDGPRPQQVYSEHSSKKGNNDYEEHDSFIECFRMHVTSIISPTVRGRSLIREEWIKFCFTRLRPNYVVYPSKYEALPFLKRKRRI